MEQELQDIAEMLAACLQSGHIIIHALMRNHAYHVQTQSGSVIWADDLPETGYDTLVRALSVLVASKDRQLFVEMFSSEQICGKKNSAIVELSMPVHGNWCITAEGADGRVLIDVCPI